MNAESTVRLTLTHRLQASKARADSCAQKFPPQKRPAELQLRPNIYCRVQSPNCHGTGKGLKPGGDSMLWITSQKRVCCYQKLYNTPLKAALMVRKCKPETRRFCGLPKPGFRVWQNVWVLPGFSPYSELGDMYYTFSNRQLQKTAV